MSEELTNRGEAIVLHDKGGHTTKLGDLFVLELPRGAGRLRGRRRLVGRRERHPQLRQPSGKVTRLRVNGLGDDDVTSMATGGGTVAFGTDSGRVGSGSSAPTS